MAHFFSPTDFGTVKHAEMGADKAAISKLFITANGNASVGVWGGGPTGERLKVQVVRSGKTVSDGKSAAVKIATAANFAAAHIQVYQIAGLKNGDEIQGWAADGRPYTAAIPVELKKPGGDVIQDWADHYYTPGARTGRTPNDQACCNFAVPYLALKDPNPKRKAEMPKLHSGLVGGPLVVVHGLAVHATAARALNAPFEMAAWGCVGTWNKSRASAHFGVAGDGTVIQFVPVSHGAYAQGNPGDRHWISVEIDNDGKSPMNGVQLDSARRIFRWVAHACGVTPKLGAGCLFPKTPAFDKLTKELCAAAGSATTTDTYEAAMSEGVSCHWWLDPRKTGNGVHYCPGPGILGQLPSITRAG